MGRCWYTPQVLADRDDVDACRAQVAQRREELIPVFSQPADNPGLGEQLGIHVLGTVEQLERPLVAATGPRDAIEPRDRFEVVIEDVGPGSDDAAERVKVAC